MQNVRAKKLRRASLGYTHQVRDGASLGYTHQVKGWGTEEEQLVERISGLSPAPRECLRVLLQ